MTHLRTLCMACILCLASASMIAQKDVSKEISASNDRWEAFFNKQDGAGLASLYTEDARVLPPNGKVVVGRKNIGDFWGGVVAPGVTAELSTVSAMAKGNMAVEEGSGKIMAEGKVVDEIKYMLEWRKVKGEWQISKDMWSSNNPPAGH